jgi:ribonuclease BN (tRNA processing enzyme)
VSGPEYIHYGGNTPCLELVYDDIRLIFDAGTGIRPLGKLLHKENIKKIDLFLSHTHWDHILGFPFFEPIFHSDVEIAIWAPQGKGRPCHDLFDEVLASEFFPLHLSELRAKLQFHAIDVHTPVQKGPVTLSFHPVHHPGVTLGFKMKTPHQTIGYVTDNELSTKQESLVNFYKGCDLLIHEAQYLPEEYAHKKGWGHSCFMDAVDFVGKTGAKKWLVSHHDPEHTDDDLKRIAKLTASKSSIPSEWVRDGQMVDLL